MKNPSRVSIILRATLLVSAIIFLPSLAAAHPGIPGHAHGLLNGFAHPFTGWDHILAMMAVGLWATQRGGRSLWAVPLTFVSVMALGGLLGMAGGARPFMETGIASSVLILGILIAASARLALPATVFIAGAFALVHGYAHGVEASATTSGLEYGTGALLATAGLHLCGMSLGLIAARWSSLHLVRCAGAAIAVCGAYLCFAA